MPEANVNVAYEFEIDKEEMAMFLLNMTFDRSVLDEEEFSYCYMQKIRINGKTSYWKYGRFYLELLDDDECFCWILFWFAKQDIIIRLCCIFGYPDTLTHYSPVLFFYTP